MSVCVGRCRILISPSLLSKDFHEKKNERSASSGSIFQFHLSPAPSVEIAILFFYGNNSFIAEKKARKE